MLFKLSFLDTLEVIVGFLRGESRYNGAETAALCNVDINLDLPLFLIYSYH